MPVIFVVLGSHLFPFFSWKKWNKWKFAPLPPSHIHIHAQDQQNSVIFHWHNSLSVLAICCAGRTHQRSTSSKAGTGTSRCEYSFHFHCHSCVSTSLRDWPCLPRLPCGSSGEQTGARCWNQSLQLTNTRNPQTKPVSILAGGRDVCHSHWPLTLFFKDFCSGKGALVK